LVGVEAESRYAGVSQRPAFLPKGACSVVSADRWETSSIHTHTPLHEREEDELRGFLADLAALSIPTPGNLALTVIANNPADNRYLECAVEGAAHLLAPLAGSSITLRIGQYLVPKPLVFRAKSGHNVHQIQNQIFTSIVAVFMPYLF
jgi:hypothetical protein